MSVTIKSSTTKRFVERSVFFSWLALLLVIIASFAGGLVSKQITNQMVRVSPQETVRLDPITLERRLIGALRIDVKAVMDFNRWVVYEIQLYDDQNQVLASARKEAWRERGGWREGGETGTWSEADLLGGLDVQLGKKQQEEITIAVSVLEHGETGGKVLQEQPVSFRVDVKNGVIDTRYLWIGFFGTLAMAILTSVSVGTAGRLKIREVINDSGVGERAIVGGEKALIRVTVKVLADETSPSHLAVSLWLKDGMGEQIYSEQTQIPLHFQGEEGEIENATGKLEQYFVLTRRGSYGFYVEVSPDQPVDQTTLTVKENVKTLSSKQEVKVITVDET